MIAFRSLLLAGLVVAGCADSPGATDAASGSHVTLHVERVAVHVRVATNRAARRRGLQGVTTLAADEGMLFVYRTPGRRSFWMKDTRLALDVAFLDASGRVMQIETLSPETPGHGPDRATSHSPAQYVLEVAAGFFARHALGPGTRVTFPPGVDPRTADE